MTSGSKYSIEILDTMEGHDFEYAVAELLKYNGWRDVKVTQGSGDYGIDILARRKSTKYAIQCKRYNGTVGVKAVQEAGLGTDYYHCDAAAVITNSIFTKQATRLAETTGVKLWDRAFLINLICNYDDGYDEFYSPSSNTSNKTTNEEFVKICPICGREFLKYSIKCPVCECDLVNINSQEGNYIQPQKHINQTNNHPQKNIEKQNTINKSSIDAPKNKISSLGIIALILSMAGCLFIFGIILAIYDLQKKDGKNKVCSIIALIIGCLWFIPFLAYS